MSVLSRIRRNIELLSKRISGEYQDDMEDRLHLKIDEAIGKIEDLKRDQEEDNRKMKALLLEMFRVTSSVAAGDMSINLARRNVGLEPLDNPAADVRFKPRDNEDDRQ